MPKYKLEFSESNLLFTENATVFQDYSKKKTFVLTNKTLYQFEFSKHPNPSKKSFRPTENPFGNAKLLHTESINEEQIAIAVKVTEGIRFYVSVRDELHLAFEDKTFHDAFGWNKEENTIHFEHFYFDLNTLGMMTCHSKYGSQFYAINMKVLLNGENPITPLNTTLELIESISKKSFNRGPVDFRDTLDLSIMFRNHDGLSFFEFNSEEKLQFLMKTPPHNNSAKSEDKIFITNLNNQMLNDIVHFNSSGMFIYGFLDSFQFIHYNPLFSEEKGWTKDHLETIQFYDINGDTYTDMVFTGPRGLEVITFDPYRNMWGPLIDTSSTHLSMRHSRIKFVVPKIDEKSNECYIFSSLGDSLHWAKVVQLPLSSSKESNAFEDPPPIIKASTDMTPPIGNKTSKLPKSPLLLREMNIWSGVLNCINPAIGKPRFSLPLVDIPDPGLKFVINYDATNSVNDILGIGWSMALNFITMDDQRSIFREDTNFVITSQDSSHFLKYLQSESTAEVQSYTMFMKTENSKFRASYERAKDQWIVNLGNGFKQLYGHIGHTGLGAVSRDIVWKEWNGAGFDIEDQLQRSRMWYLAAVQDKFNKTILELFYDVDNVKVNSGLEYTRAVYLKKTRDCQGNQIELSYKEKDAEEYMTYNSKNSLGNYNWVPINTRYLTGYSLSTPSRGHQNINLLYLTEKGNRFLKEIQQTEDVTNSPVAKFDYLNFPKNKFGLKSALLPKDVKVEFTYTPIGYSNPALGVKRFDVSSNNKVTGSENFVLVSFLHDKAPSQVVLRMFNPEMTEELYTSDSNVKLTRKGRWPLLGEHRSVFDHDVFRGDNYFGLILFYRASKCICLFGYDSESDVWLKEPDCHEYGEETVIQPGGQFFLVADPNSSVDLFEWNIKTKSWYRQAIIKTASKTTAISVYRNKFVTYDNIQLSIGYKPQNGVWMHQPLAILENCLSESQNILNRFNLEENFKNILLVAYRNNVLKFNQNLIALNCLQSNNQTLQSSLNLFTLDMLRNVSNQTEIIVKQDNLRTFVSNEENDHSGNYFNLKYADSNGTFNIKVHNLQGPIMEMLKQNPTVLSKTQITEKMEKSLNSSVKRLLINFQDYIMSFSENLIIIRNQKLKFGGSKWMQTTINEEERKMEKVEILGDKFNLVKASKNATVFLLNKKGRKEAISLTQNLTDVKMFYPMYLAVHAKGVPVQLFEFENHEIKQQSLPISESFSTYSNQLMLVTNEGFDFDDKKTVNIRKIFQLQKFLPNHVVSIVEVVFDSDKKRITGYEYESDAAKLIGKSVFYPTYSLIPGNSKKTHGWLDQSFIDGSMTAFNSDGVIVSRVMSKNEQLQADEVQKKGGHFTEETLITNKSGYLGIADTTPFRPIDEVVAYYGFEDYEENIIGRSKNWTFNPLNIVRNGFALTGRNFLRQQTEPIEGIFKPLYQDSEYTVSTWVRQQNVTQVPGIGQRTPCLKVIIQTESGDVVITLLSTVKFRIDDWVYLESIIDLPYARGIMENKTIENLHIVVRVGPIEGTSIDIDHIRFAHLNADFNVNVFDSVTELNTAVISSTGSITRKFYDHLNTVISTVNEENLIETLIAYTKSTAMKTPFCTVQIQPDKGFYEQFAPFAFTTRWKITKPSAWSIEPFILEHNGDNIDSLELTSEDISTESYGFRLLYNLVSDKASLAINDIAEIFKETGGCKLKVNKFLYDAIPTSGEMLMIIEKSRLLVWIDGVLYADQSWHASKNKLRFKMRGRVNVRDTVIFSKAHVVVKYQNALGEPTQEISLESDKSIIVNEKLYDELGRQRITTMDVRLERSEIEHLLAYIPNFVINDGLNDEKSVWKTGSLDGLIKNIVGHPYCFSETKFNNNPLNEKIRVGFPGKEFSTTGQFASRFTSETSNIFIKNRFVQSENTSFHVELKNFGGEDITVLDKDKRKIAQLVHVPGSRDLFSTCKRNENGSPVQILPPLYYEKVGSFHKMSLDLLKLNEEDLRLQMKLGSHIDYDQNGKPIRKTTADTGPSEYVYDSDLVLRFVLYYSYSKPNLVETVIYFNYDQLGRVISTGQFLDPKVSKDNLLNTPLTTTNSREFQTFNYNNFERDPNLRGRLMRTITRNGDDEEPFPEVLYVNQRGNALEKRVIVPTLTTSEPLEIAITKNYLNGRLRGIVYPATFLDNPFTVVYGYDRLGRVNSIGIPENPTLFLKTTHNAAGQILEETYVPTSDYSFKNKRSYFDVGLLRKLENPFQTEDISYTDSSYGGTNRGDGSVASINFSSSWQDNISAKRLGLSPNSFASTFMSVTDSKICFEMLKKLGYLNVQNRLVKAFYPGLEVEFPIVCTSGTTGRHVASILHRQGYPSKHGYRFGYGSHDDLTKAKYFVGSDEPTPLQPDSFTNLLTGIDLESSLRIWSLLKKAGFLVEDCDKVNHSTSQGKEGPKSFIRFKLFADLKLVNSEYATFIGPLKKLLTSRYIKQQGSISLLHMQEIFQKWIGNSSKDFAKRAAVDIYELLRRNQYFSNPLDPEFQNVLKDFQKYQPHIVSILFKHFARQLGRSDLDVESYKIDANGNHRNFNTGFKHYKLEYETDSNRLKNVWLKAFDLQRPEERFQMQHDSRGNVVQALHKGINSMKYHPVSNLLQQVTMIDGRMVTFYYDSSGRRVLKRLTGSDGSVRKEIHYLRDDLGRSLVERELNFLVVNQPPLVTVTMYVFGQNGLVGFVRRDQFYSVLTDHQGSVRLIVRNGEVVAAYDYLPFGETMSSFSPDPDAHIPYRYTGQEWDPEIGLYNYHARLYDPSIGRFYQIDPKEQYFSPYKYAGNSPVSMIDPTGELAFLPILFGIVGGWLGGAAANGSLNPLDWKFNLQTIASVGFGILTGIAFPGGFGASVAAVGGALGLGYTASAMLVTVPGVLMAYLSTAAATDKMNPLDWDLRDPKTLNAMFTGFAQGTSLFGGMKRVRDYYKNIKTMWGKGVFVGGSGIILTGLFTGGGIATDWKASRPQFWYSTFSSLQAAPDMAIFGRQGFKSVSKGVQEIITGAKQTSKNYKNYIAIFKGSQEEGLPWPKAIQQVYKMNPELGSMSKVVGNTIGVGVSAYIVGSILNNGFSNWNMTDISTYQNFLTSLQLTSHLTLTAQYDSSAKRKITRLRKSQKALKLTDKVAKKALRVYKKVISDVLDPKKELFNKAVQLKLAKGEIPNSAMSVAIINDRILVSFSSNEAPSIYLVFNHENLKYPGFLDSHIVDNNGELVAFGQDSDDKTILEKKKIQLSDDPIRNRIIEEAVNEGQNVIKRNNAREFNEDGVMEDLTEISRTYIDGETDDDVANRNRIVEAIANQMIMEGYATRQFIVDEVNGIEISNEKIRETENKIMTERRNLEQLEELEQTRANQGKRDKILTNLKRMEKALVDLKDKQRRSYTNELFAKVTPYIKRLTFWEKTNCAEPHIMAMLERQKAVFHESLFDSSNYDVRLNIDFLSTYKTKGTSIKDLRFQRCDLCLQSTSVVKNVLTDEDFMADLERSTEKAIERARSSKEQLKTFLSPIVNSQKIVLKEKHEKEKEQDRQKRSVETPKWYKNPIQWLNSSNPYGQKTFDSINNSTPSKTILELGDEFISKSDVHGILLLADVAVAKCQRRKLHKNMSNDGTTSLDHVTLLCNILQLFEESFEEAAETCGIDTTECNVDLYSMQQEVLPLLRKHYFERAGQIMLNYALSGLDTEISQHEVDTFAQVFKNLKVNHSIEELFVRLREYPEMKNGRIDMELNSTRILENEVLQTVFID